MGLFGSFLVAYFVLWALVAGLGAKYQLAAQVWDRARSSLGFDPSDAPRHLRGRIQDFEVVATMTVDPDRFTRPYDVLEVRVYVPGLPPHEIVDLILSRLRLDRPPFVALGTAEDPALVGVQPICSFAGGLLQHVKAPVKDPQVLIAHLQRIVQAARIVAAAPVAELLAANARSASDAAVRLRNLGELVDHYRASEDTARALDAALADPDPEIRRLAAMETSLGSLEAFLLDPRNPPDLRRDALEQLARKLPYSRLSPCLPKVLDAPGDGPRIGALALIAEARDRSLAPAVAPLGAGSSAALGGAVLETLVALEAGSEPELLPLLTSASPEARRFAVASLARTGTVRAVEPLLACGADRSLADEVRTAVRSIQGRMQGAEAGRLAVVEDIDGGAVSVVPAPEREKS